MNMDEQDLDEKFQNIYDEVQADLDVTVSCMDALFDHLIKTCKKLFEISEFQYGDHASDLPDDLLQDLAVLYFAKMNCLINDMQVEPKKFASNTSVAILNDSEDVSIEQVLKTYSSDITVDISAESRKDEFRKIYRNYLYKFFGQKYDNGQSKACRYETIRLAKILYDCKIENNIDLGYLYRASVLRFEIDIPSEYQKAYGYIRKKVIDRSASLEYQLPFYQIIMIEKYHNAKKSFLKSIAEGSIEYVFEGRKRYVCSVERYVRKSIYRCILDKLEGRNTATCTENCTQEIAIQAYAYKHFLDLEFSTNYDEKTNVYMSEKTYNEIDELVVAKSLYKPIYIDEIGSFVNDNEDEIIKIVFSVSDFVNNKRKFILRLKRDIDQYKTLVIIFNMEMRKENGSGISIRDVMLMIYLYEKLSTNHIACKLWDGYQEDRGRSLKIHSLLKKLAKEINNNKEDSLSKSEIVLAKKWLFKKIIVLRECYTKEIVDMEHDMQTKVLLYWEQSVPFLNGSNDSLQSFVYRILPQEQLDEIKCCIDNNIIL